MFTQTRHFRPLSLCQTLLIGGKQRAGIEQLFIEEVRIKIVAEIVMCGDVFPCLLAVVATCPVVKAGNGPAQQAKTAIQPPQHAPV